VTFDFPPFNLNTKDGFKTVLVENNLCVVHANPYQSLGGYPGLRDWYNGYCALPKASVPRRWIDGDYSYNAVSEDLPDLDVHGGLTFSDVQGDYLILGFDCNHAWDEDDPALHNPGHVLELARDMERQIVEGAKKLMEAV
jgi:hypothetical protein